ncbi:cyclin-dependent kinase 4 [Eurytemora carolleeae]|uniref:cyclin-dependent kinase 4 n=1 Tax=Eurytemora carolleeae TaxID=1294199 RepID=UPI000C75673D|nr:cyclin-dependent kinase 4 [Eurytemora carolleeae]|eukprot:XP_023341283.1 cyclin-dependent kinase 4-like [Eurytemora affinis]
MPDTAVAPPPPLQGSRGARGGPVNMPLMRDPDHYEEINVIGNGAYGTVYKARDTINDTIVAIKKVKLGLTEDGVPMQVLREISLLKQLGKANHPNIVRLLDICHGQRLDREMVLYLVFEHVDQDLNSYIEKCPAPGLGPDRIKDIIWQVVTLWYRSPEILLGNSYATPVDLWSCGCIFAELFLRKPLFPGQYEGDQLNQIFHILGTPSQSDWPVNSSIGREAFSFREGRALENLIPEMDEHAVDLLKQMLIFCADDRISAGKALLHPYFAEFGFTPVSHSSTSDTVSESSASSMSEGGSSEANTSLSPVTHSTSFSSHETSGESFGDLSGLVENGN